jgi:hypothetical protein
MAKAFISYTGHAKLDATIAAFFAEYLANHHHEVFIQTKIAPGQSWPEVVDAKLKDADYLIVLLSTQSSSSDMVIEEVRRAVKLKQAQGRPVVLPVRLGTVEMPYDLGAKVNRLQHLKWAADGDETAIATRRIELTDFTWEEAEPLLQGLAPEPDLAAKLLERVLFWTGGHPYLSQKACQGVASWAQREWDPLRVPAIVDDTIKEMFLTDGQRTADSNLQLLSSRFGDLGGRSAARHRSCCRSIARSCEAAACPTRNETRSGARSS